MWGGGHIDRHVWRWVIVPSDLARSFGAICTYYRYRVIHRAITYMRAWFKSTLERQLTLNKIVWRTWLQKKIRRYNNSPPYVTARWLTQQIPPSNFLGPSRLASKSICSVYKQTRHLSIVPPHKLTDFGTNQEFSETEFAYYGPNWSRIKYEFIINYHFS